MATITLANTGAARFAVKTTLNGSDVMDNFDGTAAPATTGILPMLNPQGTAGGLNGSNIGTARRTFLPFHFREPYGRFEINGRPGRNIAFYGSVLWAGTVPDATNTTYRLLDAIRIPENCMLARMGCYLETVTGFGDAGITPIYLAVLQNALPQPNLDPINPTKQYQLLNQWVDAIQINLTSNDQRFEQDSDVRCNAGDMLYVVIQPTVYPTNGGGGGASIVMNWHLGFKTLQRGG